MKFEKQPFSRQQVLLDGNEFIGCHFDHCRIETAGILPCTLDGCSFTTCSWGFIGPASNTVNFMAGIYQQGGEAKSLIEKTFDDIRGKRKP